MFFCQHCKAQLEDDTKFCTHCGAQVKEEEISAEIASISIDLEKSKAKNEQNFFVKLEMGEYGLAKTFWLYGFLVRILVNSILKFIYNKNIFIILIIIYFVYELLIMTGIWRAANRYQGLKIWVALAKVTVVIGVFMVIGTLPTIFNLF